MSFRATRSRVEESRKERLGCYHKQSKKHGSCDCAQDDSSGTSRHSARTANKVWQGVEGSRKSMDPATKAQHDFGGNMDPHDRRAGE